jgi:hypothetical protein
MITKLDGSIVQLYQPQFLPTQKTQQKGTAPLKG